MCILWEKKEPHKEPKFSPAKAAIDRPTANDTTPLHVASLCSWHVFCCFKTKLREQDGPQVRVKNLHFKGLEKSPVAHFFQAMKMGAP